MGKWFWILGYLAVGHNVAWFSRKGKGDMHGHVLVALFWPVALLILAVSSVLGAVADIQRRRGPYGDDSGLDGK